jgi:predicted metal-dependent phosphoesterase TrpH
VNADLHCHTKLSDGSLGLEDLILLAKKRGVDTIAITDIDCLAGTVRGKIMGERYGVNVIPGVEISAMDTKTGKRTPLLCYLSDMPDRLEGLCHRNALARKKAAHIMMLKAAKRFPISTEFIVKCATGSTNIYKQHIMQALMECGFTTEINGELYHELFDKESPVNIISEPKYEDFETVIAAIHDAGGVAVLSSPCRFDNLDSLDRLIECGLDGIEVWHPSADEEQQAMLKKLATKNKLVMTGGTDFRGRYNTEPISIGDIGTPDDALAKLISYKAKMKRQQKKAAKAAAESAE